MKITPELIIVVVAIFLFYLRIALLRGKKKRLEREFALKRRKVKGRSKGAALPKKAPGTPPFGVTSWVLVVASIVLILVGVVAYSKFSVLGWNIVNDSTWVETYSKYWHWPVVAGIIGLAFSFKIDAPQELLEDLDDKE